MALGKQHLIKFHEDAVTGDPVLDSVKMTDFSHDDSFVATTTSVVKEDFTGSINDAFTVKLSYPEGSIPAASTTLATLLTTAVDAVNVVFPSGGGAGPST